MKKVFNYMAYGLAYGFWYLMSLLPFPVLYLLSDFLYLLVARVVKYRHRVIWKNLTESFPEKSEKELRDLEKGFYHWFCDYLVETIKLMTMSPSSLRKRMRFTGMEQFNEVLNNGESCAIYLGHYCNWEWITSLPYWIPEHVQCCELYHPLENEYFDKLFKYVRERQNALCIPMQESLRKILEFKRGNKSLVVGYIADQVPLWWNIHHWVDFLHHDTPVLTGAERIVKHTRQACFYGDVRRVKRGYYECEMKLMMLNPKEAEEFELTDIYFRMLEKTIRRDPVCYLWSHNRWKRTREEFDRNWEVVDGKVLRKQKN
ncbi:lysophospholipid acyltransferase family protein [Prevotella sp. HUN102]|uniref:lysophospholipid acyltransferase family protein n=1 Tax=Prevotella sp. HUN102 TaxID=1392486 RepID=UPI00048FCF2A|nr:lysophospholipid acyltransferase family protein [Prevotella sp. HUN102]